MQHHGISRQLQRTSSGSTPRDRVTILQICSSRSLAFHQPQHSAPRHSPAVANPENLWSSTPPAAHSSAVSPTHHLSDRLDHNQRTHPRLSNHHSACRTTYVPLGAVSFLGGFRTPAAEPAALSFKRPASETLHIDKGPQRPFLRPVATIAPQSCHKVRPDMTDQRSWAQQQARRSSQFGRVPNCRLARTYRLDVVFGVIRRCEIDLHFSQRPRVGIGRLIVVTDRRACIHTDVECLVR